jgi:N-acetylglucosaminyldiphosphoundecaprenol N-acetyl-beta-D-mannosaminyltransferase
MDYQDLLKFKINLGEYGEFVKEIVRLGERGKSSYVCLANVHMFIEAQDNPAFLNVVNSADLTVPDGVPLVWALKTLYGVRQARVAGMDLLPDLISACEKRNLSVYFYGGTNEVLSLTKSYLDCNYPGLLFAGCYSPPFRKLDSREEVAVIENINSSGAKIVFVTLGCPKQEEWMNRMAGRINSVMIGVGGALPVFVDLQKRAPKWMQFTGLEWSYRLYQEPKRLWKRYLYTNTAFIFKMLKQKAYLMFR